MFSTVGIFSVLLILSRSKWFGTILGEFLTDFLVDKTFGFRFWVNFLSNLNSHWIFPMLFCPTWFFCRQVFRISVKIYWLSWTTRIPPLNNRLRYSWQEAFAIALPPHCQKVFLNHFVQRFWRYFCYTIDQLLCFLKAIEFLVDLEVNFLLI